MRHYQGLEYFHAQQTGLPSTHALANWLARDFQHSDCLIYGKNEHEEQISLAQLQLQSESWLCIQIEDRIDFVMQGHIIRTDYVPLLYTVQGRHVRFSGRCSTIGKVCGADLYLANYPTEVGAAIQQRFSIALKPLLKS